MPTKLLQALFALCILIGNTKAWASNTRDVTKLKEYYFKSYGLYFTPLQLEFLYYLSPNHKDRQKVVKAIDQNPNGPNGNSQPHINTYLTLFSEDLQDRIVNEVVTVFESGDATKVKTFLDYLGVEDMDTVFDFNANKLTRQGLKIFDPRLNLFSESGIKRRSRAKEVEEEYMRRHEPFMVTREKQLQEAAERLRVKEAQIAKLYEKILADTEETRKMHAEVINTHAALLRKEEEFRLNWTHKQTDIMHQEQELQLQKQELQLQKQELQRKYEDIMRKDEAVKLKFKVAMRKEQDLQAQEKEKKNLLNEFVVVDYEQLPKQVSEKANNKRVKNNLLQENTQAEAGFKSNMCRTYSRDIDHEESRERMIN